MVIYFYFYVGYRLICFWLSCFGVQCLEKCWHVDMMCFVVIKRVLSKTKQTKKQNENILSVWALFLMLFFSFFVVVVVVVVVVNFKF